jgi:alkyl hydroperoxide reductase subunit AhpF
MALISPSDQDRLRQDFSVMSRPVRLLFFTQTFGCETCSQVRQILDELPALSDKITIEEINFVLQPDQAGVYGIDRAPAIAVLGRDESGGERDSKIRFLGAPSGYEFISLIHAIRLVGGGQAHLSERNRVLVTSVDKPLVMRVFTTPS